MSLIPGHDQGTVSPRTRKNGGSEGRPPDGKSGAPGRLLTFQAVADHCTVSVWTVRTWVDTGKLAVVRLPGRLVRIDPAELERFIESCR
jgi:excisionase family DNA binding protein